MAANLHRSTPGRLLVLWAGLMTCVLVFAWRVHVNRADYDWCEYPTGLGDHDYYQTFSASDFHAPGLKFPGHPEGLYRRSGRPLKRSDAQMTKLVRDASNRLFVYTDARSPGKFYVKAAQDQYLEFGTRKFWPEYKPGR